MINDDWYLKRFLLATNRDVDAAFKMLDETMRWRNDMYISQIRDYHFPFEFYRIGGLFPYETDKQGNLVMYMRIKMHHKVPELEEPIKGFIVHNFNKTEKLCKGQGFVIVFDLTGLGYSNVDIPFLSFLITFGRNHFPGSLVYILVYNLPWVFSAMQKVVFAMLPEEAAGIIKFAKGDEIFKYIDPDHVPDYIPGGTCRRNFRAVAPGSKPILDLVTAYGYTIETYDRLYPQFKKDLDEAEQVLKTRTYDDPPADFFDDPTGIEWTPLPLPSQRVRQPKKRPSSEDGDAVDTFQPLSPPVTDHGGKSPLILLQTGTNKNEEEIFKKCKQSGVSSRGGLSIFPSDILSFSPSTDGSGSNFTCDLDLRNNTSSLMAYNILSTNPKCYRVAPYKGILPPSTSIRVSITNVSINGPGLRDKFRIDSTPVQVTKMSASEFRKLWSQTNKSCITTYKLTTSVAPSDSSDLADSSILTTFSGIHGPQSIEYEIDTSGISSSASTKIPAAPLELQVKRLNSRIRNLERKYSRLITILALLFMITFSLLSILVVENACGLNSILPSYVSSNIPIEAMKDQMCKLARPLASK